VALGHKLRVVSTANGEQGKYYDLAKELGLTHGVAPAQNPVKVGAWSGHWVDALMAIADGCPINLKELEDLYRGDTETMQQEFFCIFLKSAGAWLSIELISAAEDDGATTELPPGFQPEGFISVGIDFGRSGDRTCYWVDEHLGDIAWTRAVGWIHNMPFFEPHGNDQIHALTPFIEMADRVALDSTGMGLPLYEYFNTKFPGKIMGVNFGGTVKRVEQGEHSGERGLASTVKIKTDMAVRMKRLMEQRKNRIPRNMDIRQELQAIKREQTGTAITFEAPRIEVESAAGMKKKAYSHAEAFWAKAMADLAAEQTGYHLAECGGVVGRPIASGFRTAIL